MQTAGPFLKSGGGRTGVGGLTAFRSPSGVARVAYSSWRQGTEPPNNTPNPDGSRSRHMHWARLIVSATTDPSRQQVYLAP